MKQWPVVLIYQTTVDYTIACRTAIRLNLKQAKTARKISRCSPNRVLEITLRIARLVATSSTI